MKDSLYIDALFDGPPGPIGPRLIEVETAEGKSIKIGEWIADGHRWRLRVTLKDFHRAFGCKCRLRPHLEVKYADCPVHGGD
jgi:hypothetical protein